MRLEDERTGLTLAQRKKVALATKRSRCLIGDCRETLRTVPDGIAQTCVTSPPYFGLRDYGVDGQIGLESTPDAYVAELISVFREVRRVLRDDGTLWLNLGDSYCSIDKWGGGGNIGKNTVAVDGTVPSWATRKKREKIPGLKPKDLIGIPWRVAFALQADGWYLRQDIIWHKPNPMPESVQDRCTKAHEYIFLLSKSERYYFDSEAMKEPADPKNHRDSRGIRRTAPGSTDHSGFKDGRHYETRNRRSVWTVATRPYKGAHFATFPPKLIEPCILAGSRLGDVVLDPFFGSGTTGQVASANGRGWLGCEINEAYKALQIDRVAKPYTRGKR